MKRMLLAVLLLAGAALFAEAAPDLERFFAAATFAEVPPDTEILSEKVENGVRITELKFNGGVIEGKPTRIYAWYTRPDKAGKVPAVLNIHGAGLQVLKPNLNYPANGFACLSIDWAGPAKERKVPRTPPYSEFESNGNMADALSGKWTLRGVKRDGIRYGVIFARRGLEFLRSRPEVDKDHIFTAGASAGAHLSLLLVGLEPGIKASVVKYGTGYIRDLPGFFGGYFGPVSLCSKAEQDEWLSCYDPQYLIKNCKSKVLLLSGTDDIFFWMPVVLKTWREIPGWKRLLIRPNDCYQLVGDEPISVRFFRDAVSGTLDGWPLPDAPTLKIADGKLLFSAKIASAKPLKSVSLVYKVMPLPFQFKGVAKYPWKIVEMTQAAGEWVVELPDFNHETEQLVAYVYAGDTEGGFASSDTLEYPAWPRWRGLPGADRQVAAETPQGNVFAGRGEFETKSGFNFTGNSTVDAGGEHARTGKGAAYVFGGDSNLIAVGVPGVAGQKFLLRGWFRSVDPAGGSARLQINWKESKPFKYDLSTPKISGEYTQLKLEGVIPPGTTGGLVIITSPGSGMYLDDLEYYVTNP